jgi:hypothetical protein
MRAPLAHQPLPRLSKHARAHARDAGRPAGYITRTHAHARHAGRQADYERVRERHTREQQDVAAQVGRVGEGLM